MVAFPLLSPPADLARGMQRLPFGRINKRSAAAAALPVSSYQQQAAAGAAGVGVAHERRHRCPLLWPAVRLPACLSHQSGFMGDLENAMGLGGGLT